MLLVIWQRLDPSMGRLGGVSPTHHLPVRCPAHQIVGISVALVCFTDTPWLYTSSPWA